MTATVDRLRDILVRDYKINPATLTLATPLEELGIDSLGLAELLFSIEDEFGISMTSVSAVGAASPRLETVGDVVRSVDQAITAGTGTDASASGPAMRPESA